MVEHGSPGKALCCRKALRVEQSPTPTMDRERMRMKFGAFRGFTVGAGLALPGFAVSANPKISPRTVGGPAMQAPTSKRQGLCKNSIALSKFHRRGEHCSPAKALCCRKALRVEQSHTPTMNRESVLDYKRCFVISQ